ncbi:hypothetical protein DPM13_00515 [Paracoccus mutanolyticus]|uniref:Hydantoinase/oxoprolinase N-terminal domain-containing protein n=1 Tax=Paracoccus mutanolyticus TaxID=1499308 RepID=A0ABM6WNY8_9RHOB|nr:hypothetical protein DPM13_00515 [Paracoccus mutanolyticus]
MEAKGFEAGLRADARKPGADIGRHVTDIALDCRGTMYSTKVLTNYSAPEQAILDGIDIVLHDAGLTPADLDIVIHGTTQCHGFRAARCLRRGTRNARRLLISSVMRKSPCWVRSNRDSAR